MSNDLTDRYVGATLRTVPEKQRADIEAELRASIDDAVEARVGAGTDVLTAEREVLTSLGDPDRLAAGYSGRPGYLIGPGLFFDYKRLLGVLLITVVPIVVAVMAAIAATSGDGIGSIFGRSISLGITLVVHIIFWTTLVFALIERTGTEEAMEWSLDRLPLAPSGGGVKLSDTIASVVFLVLGIALLLASRDLTPITAADGTEIPIFATSMWDFWFPFLIAVLVIEIVFELIKYRVGRWTWGLASVNLALNALFVIPVVYLLVTEQVFNPEFLNEIPWPTFDPGLGLAVVFVVVSLVDVVVGFRKAAKSG